MSKFVKAALIAAWLATAAVFPSETAGAQQYMKQPIKNPKIVMVDDLQSTKDYFGRQRFIGKVQNKEKARIDYIKIEFRMWNREGEIIGQTEHFIKGKFHQFHDFQVSTSSLEPEQIGTFDIIAATPADSVYTYSYSISGIHFLYK